MTTKALGKSGAIVKAGAASASETVKTVVAVTKGAGKLATRVGKVLAPLDLFSKMHQGQGFFESIGNMGLEIGQLAVGGADWLAEKATGGEGFMEAKGSETMFQDADLLGNKDKWQTSLLEQGINKGVEVWTGQKTANKKVYSEEQENIANALEDAGVVDIGLGPGDIEDLQKLSLLDEKSLQALLDYQVWDDEDMAMITRLRDAKKQGVTAEYEKTGVFSETVNFGSLNPEDDGTMAQPVTPGKTVDPKTAIDAEPNAMSTDHAADERSEIEKSKADTVLTPETFNKLTPDVTEADTFFKAGNSEGSIFTHDTNIEKALWDIWEEEKSSIFSPQLEMFGNNTDLSPAQPQLGTQSEMIPSVMLEQAVREISIAEKQAVATSGGGGSQQNIIAPSTNTTNNNQTMIAPSTAHAPAALPGSGMGGLMGGRG